MQRLSQSFTHAHRKMSRVVTYLHVGVAYMQMQDRIAQVLQKA